MTQRLYPIPGGSLRIRTVLECMPLDDLLGFAARTNPRRPFLFVSKVLGRHIPCRPSRMRATYRLLAEGLADTPGPVWTIGMAETATGLAAGVVDTLAREYARADVCFHHTTRMPLDLEPLAVFCESHSHAQSHLLYGPLPSVADAFRETRTLVLVDDEISTGRTLEQLARRVLAYLPRIERVAVVTLANWLDPASRRGIEGGLRRSGGPLIATSWHTLLDGSFAFEPGVDFRLGALPANVEAASAPQWARADLGRRGVAVPRGGFPWPTVALDGLDRNRPVAVVGTGECAFVPFLLGEALEAAGYVATVQCTTRSPVQVGGAIAASLLCPDPYGQGVGYYLHNPPASQCLGVTVSERDPGYPPVTAAGDWIHVRVPEPRPQGGG